jgi:cobalamin biosynthesis Mg chelatase CobN
MRKHTIALVTVLALLSGASSALASGRDVINDCTDDEVLSKTYTQKEYRDALAKLPADADQYGNCRDIIARAQESNVTKGGSKKDGSSPGAAASAGGGGPGGQAPTAVPQSSKPASEQLAAATADDRAAAAAAAKDSALPEVSAADVAAAPGDSSSDLPTPILVLLALLLAGALALAVVRVRSLVHTRRA